MSRAASPLGAVARGLIAGAAGTGVMTAVQTAYMKQTGGGSSSTPGEVGRRILEGVFEREVSDEQVQGPLNDAMHWLYGTSWGAAYGIAAGSGRSRPVRGGLLFGLAVWGVSLVQLPAMKLAPPPWKYSPSQIAPDLGFHLAYGLGVGVAHRALA